MTVNYSQINAHKADFDHIYNAGDPREYFSVLGSLDYIIPDVAAPVLRQIVAARSALLGRACTVLDVGCSYGINAAVHRFPLTFAGLRSRYASAGMMGVSDDRMVQLDRRFFGSWPEIGSARFIGLDVSEPAVRYAAEVGLLDEGIVANLETDELSPADRDAVADVDILLSTGCIGYVTERTYGKLLAALTSPPWVVSFVLRMFPYDRLSETLAGAGLVTERLAGVTFVQRRFRDAEEFAGTVSALSSRGLDTGGFEADGLFQAELFISRPAADVERMPLSDLVTVSSGRWSPFGARYVQVETDAGSQVKLSS